MYVRLVHCSAPCPARKDRTRRRVSAIVPCRPIAAAAVPPIPSTLTSEIDTTIRTVITVFFKPCREPESSGGSSSSRALRFLSRPVGVEAVVAEPFTPPEVGSRTDADKAFCAINSVVRRYALQSWTDDAQLASLQHVRTV